MSPSCSHRGSLIEDLQRLPMSVDVSPLSSLAEGPRLTIRAGAPCAPAALCTASARRTRPETCDAGQKLGRMAAPPRSAACDCVVDTAWRTRGEGGGGRGSPPDGGASACRDGGGELCLTRSARSNPTHARARVTLHAANDDAQTRAAPLPICVQRRATANPWKIHGAPGHFDIRPRRYD